MDPSALIFVALAVAWAAYLVPKALHHHDDAVRSRSVERFSHTMRVLARREPVSRKSARLVVTPGRPPSEAKVEKKPVSAPLPIAVESSVHLAPAQVRARRAAAKRATRRRRNVLALLLLANLAVVGLAIPALILWWYVAIPAGLLLCWLIACRLMVRREHRALAAARRAPKRSGAVDDPEAPAERGDEHVAEGAGAAHEGHDPMADTSAGMAAVVDPTLWDPVPVTLPTYVNKPANRRTVRTIDLGGSGVWTSGRTDADAQLAREADEAEKAARQARRDGDDQRAVGS